MACPTDHRGVSLGISSYLLGEGRLRAVAERLGHELVEVYADNGIRQFSGISPMKAASRTRAPTTVKRTVRRGRRPNGHYRTRECLTEKEVDRLMNAWWI